MQRSYSRIAAAVAPALVLAAACNTAPPTVDAAASPWSAAPTLLAPTFQPGVTTAGDQIVVVDGSGAGSAAEAIDVAADAASWTALPAAPVALVDPQLAGIGALVYLLGGLDATTGAARGDAYVLDVAETPPAWAQLTAIPSGLERGGAAVVVASPRIYLFGGAAGGAALASVIYYDSQADQWCPGPACTSDQQIPALPAPRADAAAMREQDGTLIVTGGFTAIGSAATAGSDTWQLDIDEQQTAGAWSAKSPLPEPRGDAASAVIGQSLLIAGGEDAGSALATAWRYSPFLDDGTQPANEVWAPLPALPAPLVGARAAAVGQRMYAIAATAQIFDASDVTDTAGAP